MKLPKTRKRYCKHCKKVTIHKISTVKGKDRGSLKKGSIQRAMKRGRGRGAGNKGKWGSKPAIAAFKRVGSKQTKKSNLKYICAECGKAILQNKGFRAKKIEFKEQE